MVEDVPIRVLAKPSGISAFVVVEALDRHVPIPSTEIAANDAITAPLHKLLHRAASAVIERRRFAAAAAVMVVHSFSQERRWYEDFEAFLDLLGVTVIPGGLCRLDLLDGHPLYLGWATGNAVYLEA